MEDPTAPFRPSFTTAEPYMVDGMTPREGAVPPSESGGVRQSRVSRVSRQGESIITQPQLTFDVQIMHILIYLIC